MKGKTLLASAVLLASQGVMAADGWKSSVELGFIMTSGNTETQSINTKGAVEHTAGKWRNSAGIEALNVKGDSGRLSERYVGNAKTAYQYTEHSYSYVSAAGEHDPFSGYSYQASASAGYGYRAIANESTTLDLEIGPGYRQTKLRTEEDAEGDAVARLALKGEWTLSKTSKITEDLVTEGADFWITKSVTGLVTQVNGALSMKVSLTVKNNSDAPANTKATDTETGVTLVYNF